jgi:hypothetical protein
MNSTLANELLTARLVDVAKPHLFHLGGSGPATRGRMKQRRRRWPAEEKAAVVRETYESGRSVSLGRARKRNCPEPAVSLASAFCRRWPV